MNFARLREIMTDLGISASMLSVTAPGCTLLYGPPAADFLQHPAAHFYTVLQPQISQAEPTTSQLPLSEIVTHPPFGFFTALPPILEDVPAALAEVSYALDLLKANGVRFYTRYGPRHTYSPQPRRHQTNLGRAQ